jgi:hypothetical protein
MSHGRHPDAYFRFNPRGTSRESFFSKGLWGRSSQQIIILY